MEGRARAQLGDFFAWEDHGKAAGSRVIHRWGEVAGMAWPGRLHRPILRVILMPALDSMERLQPRRVLSV
jgi:hypothetical protein